MVVHGLATEVRQQSRQLEGKQGGARTEFAPQGKKIPESQELTCTGVPANCRGTSSARKDTQYLMCQDLHMFLCVFLLLFC